MLWARTLIPKTDTSKFFAVYQEQILYFIIIFIIYRFKNLINGGFAQFSKAAYFYRHYALLVIFIICLLCRLL